MTEVEPFVSVHTGMDWREYINKCETQRRSALKIVRNPGRPRF